jgi:hypothetical protein
MALIKNNFFQQVSLATIKKVIKSKAPKTKMEFWEAEIEFSHNKSDFKFKVTEPEKNSVSKIIVEEKYINEYETQFVTDIKFEKDLHRRGNVKRFWTKDEADFYILFNLVQLYKPLKSYVDDNNIVDKFNTLLDKHPELFVKELDSGKSWLLN